MWRKDCQNLKFKLMKYLLGLFFLLLITSSECFSQEQAKSRKNIVYAELGGAMVAGYGLGYERYLFPKASIKFTLRGSFGVIDHFSKITYSLGSSFLKGRKKGHLEVGLNYLFNYDAYTFWYDEEDKQFRNGIQGLIGYRYQNWESGITFRIFYVPPIGCCGSPIPLYGGASFGYAF